MRPYYCVDQVAQVRAILQGHWHLVVYLVDQQSLHSQLLVRLHLTLMRSGVVTSQPSLKLGSLEFALALVLSSLIGLNYKFKLSLIHFSWLVSRLYLLSTFEWKI